MLALGYSAALPVLNEVGAVAGTVVGVCVAITTVATLVQTVRSNRRKVRAKALRIGWQVQSDAASTGALVLNESKATFQGLVLTVTCGIRGRTARRDIAVLQAGDKHVWPSQEVHRSVTVPGASARHDTTPHPVQVTFRDRKGYWVRDEERLDRIRSLVIWAERHER